MAKVKYRLTLKCKRFIIEVRNLFGGEQMEQGSLVFIIIIFWIVQFLFSMLQNKDYNRVIQEMKSYQSGYLGVGIARSKFNLGPGTVIILVVDNEGIILDLREMHGFSVFARFKQKEELIGQPVQNLIQSKGVKVKKKAIEQAVTLINKERKKRELAVF